jgi:beta-phosphoglucomutase-like phosphatase (HAD superfamily)
MTHCAVLFDMDGLMFDTEYMYFLANKAGAERLGYNFTMEEHEQTIGTSTENFIDYIQELFDDEKETTKLFMEYSNEALFEITQKEEIGIKNGLIDLLDYLNKKEVQCVIASNSNREMIQRLIKRTKLDHYFDAVVGADEVSKGKPYPDLYLEAWKKTEASKKHTWGTIRGAE